ncbi:substrate-binding periplasmic protein [Pararhodospirillum photometricum]|nr:transporter substrate-binding domain-containing protein [Pararhodospirillum photometricum]
MVGRFGQAAALALALMGGATTAQAACALSVGWEAFEPFQLKTAEGTVGGIDADLLREAAKGAGCEVTFKETPWKRLLSEIEAGKTDAAMGASITPEREVFAQLSIPYRKDEFVAFVRTGETDRLGPEGLAGIIGPGLRLGVVGGYEYGDTFAALKKDPAFAALIQEAAGTDLNLRKLLSNRLDVFLENNFVGLAIAKTEGASGKIEIHPKVVSSDDVVFLFSKKSVPPEAVAAINQALTAMKQDGRYDQILARYLK